MKKILESSVSRVVKSNVGRHTMQTYLGHYKSCITKVFVERFDDKKGKKHPESGFETEDFYKQVKAGTFLKTELKYRKYTSYNFVVAGDVTLNFDDEADGYKAKVLNAEVTWEVDPYAIYNWIISKMKHGRWSKWTPMGEWQDKIGKGGFTPIQMAFAIINSDQRMGDSIHNWMTFTDKRTPTGAAVENCIKKKRRAMLDLFRKSIKRVLINNDI